MTWSIIWLEQRLFAHTFFNTSESGKQHSSHQLKAICFFTTKRFQKVSANNKNFMRKWVIFDTIFIYTRYTQKNGAVSKVNKRFISHLTQAQRTPSAAATVQVSHALPAVRFSCLLRGHGASFQDGVAAGKGFLCAPFWGVQICDYSAEWVSCTV